MNDIYRLMQEDNAKFGLYLPESLEWLLLKADLLGQPDVLEILEHPADFIESSEFFSWERFFTNLLEQRTKDVPYMRYDKAKLPEFDLQEENLEKIIAEMGKTLWKFTNNVSPLLRTLGIFCGICPGCYQDPPASNYVRA